jgi:hypothetical protein
MRKFFSALPLLLLAAGAGSQELSQITFSGGANLSSFSFHTDQGVLIRISQEGTIIEWGVELQAQRGNYFAPNLQPYMGRVDYYGPGSDSVSKGKVKNIGTCVLTYYGPYEMETKIGKIKSVGSVAIDYYTNYDNAALKGKLKFIGSLALEYYSSFENEAFRGKLKSVSNTPITYYSTFDDKLIKGKIKSIGAVAYTWYSSIDNREYAGALKSGSYRQNINGITYILR